MHLLSNWGPPFLLVAIQLFLPRSRGSTGRTSTNPMGSCKGTTYLHNLMVGRVSVLILIAVAKAVWWKLEQPKGSLLEGHLLFQALLRLLEKLKVKVTRVSTSLCWFGADTVKPLWVYSSILTTLIWHHLAFEQPGPNNPISISQFWGNCTFRKCVLLFHVAKNRSHFV